MSLFIVTIFVCYSSPCAGVTVLEVIASQMVAYGTIAFIQAAILIVFGIYVVNVSVCHVTCLLSYGCNYRIYIHLTRFLLFQ